jgi:hypothetical protein
MVHNDETHGSRSRGIGRAAVIRLFRLALTNNTILWNNLHTNSVKGNDNGSEDKDFFEVSMTATLLLMLLPMVDWLNSCPPKLANAFCLAFSCYNHEFALR